MRMKQKSWSKLIPSYQSKKREKKYGSEFVRDTLYPGKRDSILEEH